MSSRAPKPDPFVVAPVDAESLAMENRLRRRGMLFGILIASLGLLAILTGVLIIAGSGGRHGFYWTGGGVGGVIWGFGQYFKFHQREY